MSMTTVLFDERVTGIADAKVEGEHLWLKPDDMKTATGWKLEPQGLCKGDACVRTQQAWVRSDGRIDLTAFANYMGQPITREASANAWALGESVNARRDAMRLDAQFEACLGLPAQFGGLVLGRAALRREARKDRRAGPRAIGAALRDFDGRGQGFR